MRGMLLGSGASAECRALDAIRWGDDNICTFAMEGGSGTERKCRPLKVRSLPDLRRG